MSLNPGSFVCRRTAFGALLVIMSASLSSGVSAQNASLSLDLNDDAVRIAWAQFQPERKIRLDASLLHHQDRGNVLSGGFHITGNAASVQRPINAGLGGRVLWAKADLNSNLISDKDGFGLAVGGFFDAKVPNYDRVGFGGHLYYAPDVLAFGGLREYTDFWLFGSYSVLRQGDVYLGYRNVKGDFSNLGDFTFDTGVHVGFTLKF